MTTECECEGMRGLRVPRAAAGVARAAPPSSFRPERREARSGEISAPGRTPCRRGFSAPVYGGPASAPSSDIMFSISRMPISSSRERIDSG